MFSHKLVDSTVTLFVLIYSGLSTTQSVVFWKYFLNIPLLTFVMIFEKL